jgi:hypothetical protein
MLALSTMKIGWLLVLLGTLTAAKAKVPTPKITVCDSGALKRKDCTTHVDRRRIHLRDDTMNVFDGVQRALLKMPVSGVGVEWEKIEVQSTNQRHFLSLQIWSDVDPATDLSQLHWLVFELKGVNLEKKIEDVVRRRKRVVVDGTFRFELDQVKKDLKFENIKGQIRWSFGDRKGLIQ